MSIPKALIMRIINQFETGTPEGEYDKLSIQDDGINASFQITYGRSQTTEQGNLRFLLEMYVEAEGLFSPEFLPYLERIGRESLVTDGYFHELLIQAAREDPIMRQTQDHFFDSFYWQPAERWCASHGISSALGHLIVYDSQVHSGGVPLFLRKRFRERPPSAGGNEQRWLAAYVEARHQWLKYHKRPLLRACIYRTRCFMAEIARNNWDLTQLPINANGREIS